ncbi:hypothetical protein SVIOM342S_03564 [Streptomyces violaceorubidus]
MFSALCSRLPWLIITPLGSPVEPEVYWSTARVEWPVAGIVQSPGPGPASSVASRGRPPSPSSAHQASTSPRVPVSVRIAAAPESSAMRRTRCRSCR